MKVISHLIVFVQIVALALSLSQKPLTSDKPKGPNIASATENAVLIFNAVHSAMKQWGSSIQHNGMSFFPASIPEGTLFYHGGSRPDRLEGMEWVAFEVAHAELFAIRPEKRDHTTQSASESGVDEVSARFRSLRNRKARNFWNLDHNPEYEIQPGYVHVYQVNRPMKVLYVDGMAAANCGRGTLDSQDLLLLNFTGGIWEDFKRAAELCTWGAKWGIEGFVRMECGFEVIMCDFAQGLDFISHNKRPARDEPEGLNEIFSLDFVRDVASRYDGIDGGRVQLDYSSMVSAYFYPTNLSNPSEDPGQSRLPRLVASEDAVLQRIKSDLELIVGDWKPTVGLNWQGVANMIVKRFSARLQWMATGLPIEMFLSQLNALLSIYIDHEAPQHLDLVALCSEHYLRPIKSVTESDRMIEGAFKIVTGKICSTLSEARNLLLAKESLNITETGAEMDMIRHLIDWLNWSDFQACGQCGLDEVCFTPMFPYGTAEDYYHPHCVNFTYIHEDSPNYWLPAHLELCPPACSDPDSNSRGAL